MRDNREKNDGLQRTNLNPGPVFYEIKIQGQLDSQWSIWFEGMNVTHIENGESDLACTLIAGPVVDQPALHGLLTKIRDLNLTLISVHRSVPEKNTLEEVPIKPEPFEDGADFA